MEIGVLKTILGKHEKNRGITVCLGSGQTAKVDGLEWHSGDVFTGTSSNGRVYVDSRKIEALIIREPLSS